MDWISDARERIKELEELKEEQGELEEEDKEELRDLRASLSDQNRSARMKAKFEKASAVWRMPGEPEWEGVDDKSDGHMYFLTEADWQQWDKEQRSLMGDEWPAYEPAMPVQRSALGPYLGWDEMIGAFFVEPKADAAG